MFATIFQLNDISIFLLLALVTLIFSIIAVHIVRRHIPLKLRYEENVVMGIACTTISVIFGVLAGITSFYLTNNNNYASDAVQHEASAVANLYRDSLWLKEPHHQQIQKTLMTYVDHVMKVEWPQMEYGKTINEDGDLILHAITELSKNYPITNNVELMSVQEILNDLKTLYNARHQRINMSYVKLNPEIWVMVFICAVLMLVMSYLLGTNFYIHITIVSAVALTVTSIIFLLITLDRPFQGEFAIDSGPFQALIDYVHAVKKS